MEEKADEKEEERKNEKREEETVLWAEREEMEKMIKQSCQDNI